MIKEIYAKFIKDNWGAIMKISLDASELHDVICNQKYDDKNLFSYHLGMVATYAIDYGHTVCFEERHVLPILFAAYFHDSIEDARLSYNDVFNYAGKYMDNSQANVAAEIVYALTNEKGRTRAERENDKYYEGIRCTLYAPFVKWCDRIANYKHAVELNNSRMIKMYNKEMSKFFKGIGYNKFISQELCNMLSEMVETTK